MTPDVPHIPVFDGHNDTLVALHLPGEDGPRSFFERSDRGHIDLPRALEGGFAGGFFAICVPPIAGPALRSSTPARRRPTPATTCRCRRLSTTTTPRR